MPSFICKALIRRRTVESKTDFVRYIRTLRASNTSGQQSLTVSYLTKSCGLSLEKAIEASKLVNIRNTEKPDSVIELLKAHGFNKSHIARLISKHPPLILASAEKNLKPKIEYFESLGILGSDLCKMICSNKRIFLSSLKNQIIPNFDFLKGLVETNENLLYAVKQSSHVMRLNLEKMMVPNISILRAHGVPEVHIKRLVVMQAGSLMLRVDLFKEVANEVKQMGFEPMRGSFILAIRSMSMLSKVKWDKKKELLKDYGWSESEFQSAFGVQPMFMLCSEKKLREVIDFFVDKEGLRPSDVAKCPNLFLASIDKRIKPRCLFLRSLISKGLFKKNIDIVWAVIGSKKEFEKRFLTPYVEVAPEEIKRYQCEIGFQGLAYKLQGFE